MRIKREVSDLALFGGVPAFAEPLHVGRPNLGSRERLLARIEEALDRRWLTNHGPFVREFEQRIAELVGVRHCIALCNATVGLEIAARAAGLSGEVIVPSLTFVATAHALQWQNITPVFCDVDPDTLTLDPARVEERITSRTSGILAVHLWGRSCHVEELTALADRHNLKLLFDAAHAFGCSRGGRMIGGFGDAEVFSFHATKFMNSLEGGALVTNDDELARRVRLMENFGFAGYDEVVEAGTNGKMNELSAAMGLTGLESLEDFIEINRLNHARYADGLAGVPGMTLRPYDHGERCNYQYVVVEVDPAQAGLTRDELVSLLWAENVLARRYFYPGCHRMEPYRSLFPAAASWLPVTEHVVQRTLVLPTGSAVSFSDIDAVCEILEWCVRHADEVRARQRSSADIDWAAVETWPAAAAL